VSLVSCQVLQLTTSCFIHVQLRSGRSHCFIPLWCCIKWCDFVAWNWINQKCCDWWKDTLDVFEELFSWLNGGEYLTYKSCSESERSGNLDFDPVTIFTRSSCQEFIFSLKLWIIKLSLNCNAYTQQICKIISHHITFLSEDQ
jgi:hypothetical protein